MRKILIITIIALFFLPLIRAETGGCLSNLRIELATYETDTHNETIILEKSVHQPNDAQGFAKQGDILYVEKLTANVNATCLQNNDNKREEVNIQFKRPYEDVWGEDIPILLQITDSKINFYWMKLRDANFGRQARYEDSIGWKDIAIPAIKLDEEGVWDVRVIYDSEEKHDLLTNYKSGDSDIIIPGRIEVEPRVSISILDTNKQILKDSDESSRTSIKIAIESTILAFIVGFAGILSTIFLTKKQLDKMDLLHMQQIEKQDKIEKDKQYGILDGLKHNIDIIKDNLVGHKKEFKLGNFILPSYSLNELNPIYYATNLAPLIKNHSTKQLKILIFKVNDKVTQINDTLKIIREFLYFSDVTKAISIRDDLIKEDGAYSDSLNLLIKLETELNKISENKTFP